MARRQFPLPWTAEVTPNCFIVRDDNGQQIAYVYYECEPGRRSAAKLLSKDEAREYRQAAGATSTKAAQGSASDVLIYVNDVSFALDIRFEATTQASDETVKNQRRTR